MLYIKRYSYATCSNNIARPFETFSIYLVYCVLYVASLCSIYSEVYSVMCHVFVSKQHNAYWLPIL